MDRTEVKAIVDRELEPTMRRLGVPHWKITVSYGLRGESDGARTEAQCTRLLEYHKAWIEFDPDQFEDESHVLATLRHELMHVVLAPIDLYVTSVKQAIADESIAAVLERVWVHAVEQSVINLERMFAGLTSQTISE